MANPITKTLGYMVLGGALAFGNCGPSYNNVRGEEELSEGTAISLEYLLLNDAYQLLESSGQKKEDGKPLLLEGKNQLGEPISVSIYRPKEREERKNSLFGYSG